jgi:cytochrome c553
MKIIMYWVLLFSSCASFALENNPSGQEKSSVCAACHGATGQSSNSLWPHLAGQHATYIIKQLRDFKAGESRHAAIMTPFVASLNKQDMTDLALFYSKQPLVTPKKKNHQNLRGEQLYRRGDAEKQITACIACHGPTGLGNEEAGFPALAGQQKDYTIQQLKAFKKGTRQNDSYQIMRTISARMSHKDMAAVADYLSTLH